MKYIVFLFVFVAVQLNAQVVLNRSHHHFGTITKSSERFTDFVLTNKSKSKIYILRLECERDVSTLSSTKTLLPDSSATIRVQVNPKETGRFTREIGIYISSQEKPLQVTLSGDVKELPGMTDLACPDFNKVTDVGRAMEFVMSIDVIDKLTGEPVEDAQVKIIYLGLPKYVFETNSKGHIEKKIPLGYYYFVTKSTGYYTEEFDAYVNVRNNRLVVELTPIIEKPIDEPPLDSLFYLVEPIPPIKDPGKPIVEKEPVLSNDDQLLSPKDTLPVAVISLPGKNEEGFSEKKYIRNNIVFLIDVSGSMMEQGKMELLKSSMIELTKMLRSVDQISIVVYDSKARVVLDPVSGDRKEEVISKIQQMEGSGYTAGAEGMKMAYQVAEKNFIPGGNNIVIMATDGAFNMYTNDVGPMVKRYLKKGIKTSVVGIKNTERDAKSMENIALTGQGNYIPINNLDQALSSLTMEIKNGSKIGD